MDLCCCSPNFSNMLFMKSAFAPVGSGIIGMKTDDDIGTSAGIPRMLNCKWSCWRGYFERWTNEAIITQILTQIITQIIALLAAPCRRGATQRPPIYFIAFYFTCLSLPASGQWCGRLIAVACVPVPGRGPGPPLPFIHPPWCFSGHLSYQRPRSFACPIWRNWRWRSVAPTGLTTR